MQRAGLFLSVAALVASILSGCLSDDSSSKSIDSAARLAGRAPAFYSPEVAAKLLAHNGLGLDLEPTSLFQVLPSVSYVSVGQRGPEPSIGVTKNGMIFFQAIAGDTPTGPQDLVGPATLRSDDGGKTWRNVARPPLTSPTTLDPFLWVDPDTDRVFVDHLYLACSYLSYSDDYGQTWVANPIACGMAGNDHQKIATGKFRAPLQPTSLYRNVVYYGYNDVTPLPGVSRVSVSLDGGLTWPVNSEMVTGPTCSGGLHGRLHTGPDGYVYVPKRDCNGTIVAASADNGRTWSQVKLGLDVGATTHRKNTELAVDSENNLYVVWPGKDNRLYLSVSRDHGKTWSPSLLASPPEVTTTTMPSIVAGSAGRIGFAYYGVFHGNGKIPECVGNDETWDVYVTWSLNGLDADAEFVTTRANEVNDPVQIGGISTNSGPPPSTEKDCKYRRNLLDFIDMTLDAEGRVYVATADGCISCERQDQSTGSMGMSSVQLSGPSLLADRPDFLEGPKGPAG